MDNKDNKVFCLRCNKEIEYKLIETDTHTKYNGQDVNYKRQDAICPTCGAYLTGTIPELFDVNFQRVEAIVRKGGNKDGDSSN